MKALLSSYLAINPSPTKKEIACLIASLRIPAFSQESVYKQINAMAQSKLTEMERVLINDYDPACINIDKLLINDGDNLKKENNSEDSNIAVDGPIDTSSIEDFERFNL